MRGPHRLRIIGGAKLLGQGSGKSGLAVQSMGSRPLERLLELGRCASGNKACINDIRTPALEPDTLNNKEQPSLVLNCALGLCEIIRRSVTCQEYYELFRKTYVTA